MRTQYRGRRKAMKDSLPKILVADDDLEVHKMVEAALSTVGARLLRAENGEQALELARREKPALMILDVMMPVKNGWEVLHELRRDDALKDTPVLMLTGIGSNLNEMTSPLMGANDYLDKPFSFEQLSDRVKHLLGTA
ncbi:MAG: response regulator [Deltaproteobacteria bacterium]|nr:MAG: response regulator [Deltaproteobacteria bacterium]